MRSFVDTHGIQRIYIAKIGPFGIILVALATGILLAVLLVFLLSAFLFLIPVVGLLVAAAFISGVFRSHFQRLP